VPAKLVIVVAESTKRKFWLNALLKLPACPGVLLGVERVVRLTVNPPELRPARLREDVVSKSQLVPAVPVALLISQI
jgi:hypothetical protein